MEAALKRVYVSAPYSSTPRQDQKIEAWNRKYETAPPPQTKDRPAFEKLLKETAPEDIPDIPDCAFSEAAADLLEGKKASSKIIQGLFVAANLKLAEEAGLELAKKRPVVPVVPHLAMAGWQDPGRLSDDEKEARERVMLYSLSLLAACDEVVVVGDENTVEKESKGVHQEVLAAKASQKPVHYWNRPKEPPPTLDELQSTSEDQLTVYRECADSYRHTYQTIWQAGTVLIALSVAVLAFAARAGQEFWWSAWFAGLPFLFWFYGIFLPMDDLGHRRWATLKGMEEGLSLRVTHFAELSKPPRGRRRLSVHPWVMGTGIAVTALYMVGVVGNWPAIQEWLFCTYLHTGLGLCQPEESWCSFQYWSRWVGVFLAIVLAIAQSRFLWNRHRKLTEEINPGGAQGRR